MADHYFQRHDSQGWKDIGIEGNGGIGGGAGGCDSPLLQVLQRSFYFACVFSQSPDIVQLIVQHLASMELGLLGGVRVRERDMGYTGLRYMREVLTNTVDPSMAVLEVVISLVQLVQDSRNGFNVGGATGAGGAGGGDGGDGGGGAGGGDGGGGGDDDGSAWGAGGGDGVNKLLSLFSETLLYGAALNGHANAVTMLLKAGADPRISVRNATSGALSTPLSIACQNGHTDVVTLLLASDFLKADSLASLAVGAVAGTERAVGGGEQLYLLSGEGEAGELAADELDFETRCPLFAAAQNGYVDVVRLLLTQLRPSEAVYAQATMCRPTSKTTPMYVEELCGA